MNLNKLIKLICAGAIVGACLLATGCNVNVNTGDTINNNLPEEYKDGGYTQKDDGTVISDSSKLDFTNYVTYKNESNFSIKVRNNTSQKLVAFYQTPSTENLISGIPAGAKSFGLKRTSKFTDSSDFVLFLVTEDTYSNSKNDLESLAETPFARLYAYYNANSDDNNVVYEISGKMGGEYSITLDNGTSPYNVELRLDGIFGKTIGYTMNHTLNTTFKVTGGDYYVFPVFRKYDPAIDEIITVFPKDNSGLPIYVNFPLDENHTSKTLNSVSWWQDVTFSPSASYITIHNHCADKSISFYKGTEAQQTSLGSQLIASSDEKTFCIEVGLKSGSYTNNPVFKEFVTESLYSIGNKMTSKYYIVNNSTNAPDSGFDFYAGKQYNVHVYDSGSGFRIDLDWQTKDVVSIDTDLK